MKRLSMLLVAVVIVIGITSIAHAALIVRGTDIDGNQLIYDTDLNITWYDFSNAPALWWDQMVWADSLSVVFNGTIYEDWRLPVNDDCFFNICTGSEMGHLYYTELGNSMWGPLSTSFTDGLTGLAESFLNLQSYIPYWSSTDFFIPNTAFGFDFSVGHQGYDYKDTATNHGLAVRSGDVSAVPEPGTMLLLGGGLVGLLAGRRMFKR